MLFGAASIAVIGSAYLLGSIPTGYWTGRILKGIDIREHGSKSTGATNVLRTLGKGPALFVLFIDVLKGAAAVALARWVYQLPAIAATIPAEIDAQAFVPWAVTIATLMALLGHSRSVWINFTGGKSVATGLGALFAMSWVVGLSSLSVFCIVLGLSRIVSLSSILAVIAAMVLMIVWKQPLPYVLVAIAGGTYVILRHRANMQRLLAGTEPRIGQVQRDPEQPSH
jgi:acyl phosphate:glycerol-3-phosphate acyltransferase